MKFIKLFLLLSLTSLDVNAAEILFIWNKSVSPTVEGYTLFWGDKTKEYANSVDVGNVSEYKLTGLLDDTTYFVALKAYDKTNSIESGFSNEASARTSKPVVVDPVEIPSFKSEQAGFSILITPLPCATCKKWDYTLPGTLGAKIVRPNAVPFRVIYPVAGTYVQTVTVSGTKPDGSVFSYTYSHTVDIGL